MPIISIVIPIYNSEKYLSRCIDSILCQSFTNWELILVDDGSTDNSGHICDRYASVDDRVRVFHCPNGGAAAARNFGVFQAKGIYICFIDSDDTIPEHSLELLYEPCSNNQIDISIGGYNRIFSSTNQSKVILDAAELSGGDFLFSLLSGNWKIYGPCAKLYKRNLFVDLKSDIPAIIKVGEDLLMNICIGAKAKRVVFLKDIVYNYYQIDTSAMHTFSYSMSYMKMYIPIVKHNLELNEVPNINELLSHYKLNLLYNVMLDDLGDNLDYSALLTEIKKELNICCFTKLEYVKYAIMKVGFIRRLFRRYYKK